MFGSKNVNLVCFTFLFSHKIYIMSEGGVKEEDALIPKKHVPWSPEHENILVEWADKAMCYRWLHTRAFTMYSKLNAWYTIPVIIISTLTGTANFAQTRVPVEYQNSFAMGVGAFNILGGIITTIQQFLKVTQLNEAHRVSSISWDKFYRNIKIELAKHPEERLHVEHMIKMSKEEYDRLMETSPNIPDKIVKEFKLVFKKNGAFDEILKPEICDVLVSTEKSKNPWSSDENREKRLLESNKNSNIKEMKEKMIKESNQKMVKEFKISFFNLNYREPMENEIVDNLKDKINVEVLKEILEKNDDSSIENV